MIPHKPQPTDAALAHAEKLFVRYCLPRRKESLSGGRSFSSDKKRCLCILPFGGFPASLPQFAFICNALCGPRPYELALREANVSQAQSESALRVTVSKAAERAIFRRAGF